MLFQIDLTRCTPEEAAGQFRGTRAEDEELHSFADRLVRGVGDQRHELDRWIVGSAENWRLERMAIVDRNVLRMAVYEMLSDPDTPPAVVIDEAIEIAKKFGSADSGGFINGILDSIRSRIEEQRAQGHPPGDLGRAESCST
jgi:N utilization substance protein B